MTDRDWASQKYLVFEPLENSKSRFALTFNKWVDEHEIAHAMRFIGVPVSGGYVTFDFNSPPVCSGQIGEWRSKPDDPDYINT